MRVMKSNGTSLQLTLGDFRADRRARRISQRTLDWYEQKLEVALTLLAKGGVTTTDQLTIPVVHRLIEQLDDGTRSGQTVKGYVQTIKSWLLYLEAEDLVNLHTRERIKLPRVPKRLIKTLSPTTIDMLFAAVRFGGSSPWLRLRDTAILHLLLDTGIRAGELCRLRRRDIDLDDDPHVRVVGKGDKERQVGPLSPECVRACRRYLRAVGPLAGDSPFFLSRHQKALTVWGLDQLLYRLRDHAGLRGEVEVRAHVFRHTYALDRIRDGMDVHRLSKLLGHTSLLVTEGYLRDFDQREARRSPGRATGVNDRRSR